MTPQLVLDIITCNCFVLMAFVALFNPSKVNVVANRWLGVFFASVGCALCNVILYNASLGPIYQRLIGFNELSRFAMAPALYLAIVQFTTPGAKFRPVHFLHFAPFALFFVYMVPSLYFPGQHVIDGVSLSPSANFMMAAMMRWSVRLQMVIYWLLALNRLYKHRTHIRLIASNTVPVNLSWLMYLLLTIGGMLLLYYMGSVFSLNISSSYIAGGYLLGALTIFYYALAQKEIFPFEVAELQAITVVIDEADTNVRPMKSRVSDEYAINIRVKLEKVMQIEKLYLDNELSLPQLAGHLDISVHDLSFVLNETIGLNFFQFVNGYRVEEAKQLMFSDKHKHLNMLGIAYNAGFSSKTTFNTVFKSQTGLSPSAFIQQNKSSRGVTPATSGMGS